MNGMEDMNGDENVGEEDEFEGKRKVTYQVCIDRSMTVLKASKNLQIILSSHMLRAHLSLCHYFLSVNVCRHLNSSHFKIC